VLAVRQVESRIAGADCGEVLFLKSAKKTKDAQEKSRKVKAFAERFFIQVFDFIGFGR
jgi:hypothetical protein